MRKILLTPTLLLANSGFAFAASDEFFFYNKLGLLITASVFLGGLLTLFCAAFASALWVRFFPLRVAPQPLQGRDPKRPPHANPADQRLPTTQRRTHIHTP